MKIRRFRIPTHIVLPGLLVNVKQVMGKESDLELQGADATWDYDDTTAVIRLRKNLPIKRKRYLLLHELIHVIADYHHDAGDNHQHIIKQ
jgi:Zn-dependent peptidase ImmA (M78 family)